MLIHVTFITSSVKVKRYYLWKHNAANFQQNYYAALSTSRPLGFHLLYDHSRFAFAVLSTHFALLQGGTMRASVACFAEVTLSTIAFDLGADLKVFHVINKTHSITEVFKRDLEAFEVWSRLVILLLHIKWHKFYNWE